MNKKQTTVMRNGTDLELKPAQWDVFLSDARFRVLVAGRRFGKTFLALAELCQAAWKPGRLVWYVAPTYKQAKRIAWSALKQMTRRYWKKTPNETDLRIELVTGGTIALRGADNFDSLRGDGLDFLVLDEYASMDPRALDASAATFPGRPGRTGLIHRDTAGVQSLLRTIYQGPNVARLGRVSSTPPRRAATFHSQN